MLRKNQLIGFTFTVNRKRNIRYSDNKKFPHTYNSFITLEPGIEYTVVKIFEGMAFIKYRGIMSTVTSETGISLSALKRIYKKSLEKNSQCLKSN